MKRLILQYLMHKMDRLELCNLAYAIKSVFLLKKKVIFMTNMSPNSVTDQGAKEVLLSFVDQPVVEYINL